MFVCQSTDGLLPSECVTLLQCRYSMILSTAYEPWFSGVLRIECVTKNQSNKCFMYLLFVVHTRTYNTYVRNTTVPEGSYCNDDDVSLNKPVWQWGALTERRVVMFSPPTLISWRKTIEDYHYHRGREREAFTMQGRSKEQTYMLSPDFLQ